MISWTVYLYFSANMLKQNFSFVGKGGARKACRPVDSPLTAVWCMFSTNNIILLFFNSLLQGLPFSENVQYLFILFVVQVDPPSNNVLFNAADQLLPTDSLSDQNITICCCLHL